MPKMSFSVPHEVGQQEAIDRLKQFLPRVKQHYQSQISDLTESWEGNVLSFGFKTYGIGIQGNMTVEDDQVVYDGSLPMTAMMFKGKIEESIRTEISRLLSA